MADKKADIIIVGTGASGLFCALNLPKDKDILMISKDDLDRSDSFLAQGGICMLKSDDDYESYFEDTMRAGHYENNKDSVRIMIKSSQKVIEELINIGVDFEREDGKLKFTREAAHSKPRILFHEDLTGKEITSKLLAEAMKRDNITIIAHTTMVDIIEEKNVCEGIVIRDNKGNIEKWYANYVVLACGGIGGLYEHSTNYSHLTGDALAIALKHNIALKDIDYIQIHPTTLYSTKRGRRFLISESVRGEGAILYNANMERFVDELLPRDLLTKEIKKQMKKDNTKFVWLSVKELGSDNIKKRFPNIYKKCLEEGYDITKECIPVTPAQHYFMGGIKVNTNSKTSMNRLYASGETSCNGVHGANRLASNSLLEAMVFAKRAAKEIIDTYDELKVVDKDIDLEYYKDAERLEEEYRELVLEEIEKVHKKRENKKKAM
ncbi:MAG: L-aspartate oxidase [Lachnospiraceae bacterium]|nr:L-aspartate oxidase [Lachnospiraceae bacterium]